MKKIFFLAVLLVSILIIPVSAANVGDKIGEALYTDIVAYVNNHPTSTTWGRTRYGTFSVQKMPKNVRPQVAKNVRPQVERFYGIIATKWL